MQFRNAKREDIPKLITLWKDTFEDDSQQIENWILNLIGFENIFVCEENERIISQLFGIEGFVQSCKAIYFYALATEKDRMGYGLMTKLLLHAESEFKKRNFNFSCLVPANESLFDFYRKRGYKKSVMLNNFTYNRRDIQCGKNTSYYDKISAEKFKELRKRFIKKSYLDFETPKYSLILDDFFSENGRCFYNNNCYAMVVKDNCEYKVIEIFSNNLSSANELLEFICQTLKVEEIKVTTIQEEIILLHNTQKFPFGMVKNIGDKNVNDEFYMRMIFEDYS